MKQDISLRLFRVYKRVFQAVRYHSPDHDKTRYILVVGVQRSGTNMVMEMFVRGLPYAEFSESDARVFDNYELRPLDEVKQLTDCVTAPFIVLKPMTDMYRLDELLRYFPNSQGLWVYRRMSDVVNSQVRKWTGMPDSLRRIRAERYWNNWRAGGISDHSYEIISELAHDELDNETACAIFWYVRNIQFFEQTYDQDDRIFLVPYNRFVSDPHKSFTRLFNVMNAPINPYMTQHIHAQSVKKDKPPAICGRVAALCQDLERRFAAHFDALSL